MEAVRLGNELTPMEQENLPPVHKLDAEKVELVEQRNNRRFKMKMPTFRRRAAKETVNEEAEDEEEEEVVEAETEEMPKKRKRFFRGISKPRMPSMKPRFKFKRSFKGFRH